MKGRRLKKSKDKLGQRELVNQNDFYTEATEYEEQGERWILSDVKKTLRFYVQAFEIYERGLQAPNGTLKGTYDIMYNETRLLLQVHTEYVSSNGYINLLAYVNLNDIPGLQNLLIPLTDIAARFEEVYERFEEVRTWDLEFNLLTCYLALLESAEVYSLTGGDIIELAEKFVKLTERSLKFQAAELQSFNNTDLMQDDGSKDDVGPGDVPSLSPNLDNDGVEIMEQADHVTSETFTEVLIGAYKFIQLAMELLIEQRSTKSNYVVLDPLQMDQLEVNITNFHNAMSEIHAKMSNHIKLDEKELSVVLEVNKGIEIVGSGAISSLENYIGLALNEEDVNQLLGKIDVLTFAISCLGDGERVDVEWTLCTMLNKLLTRAYSKISSLRGDVLSGKVKDMSGQLSHLVFEQCDVLIHSSDNELRRWYIKTGMQSDNSSKTLEVLMKNATTLLINASKIAERPCGLEENIVDKLKRNYIYNQAQARLSIIKDSKNSDTSQVSDIVSEHPFYRTLSYS